MKKYINFIFVILFSAFLNKDIMGMKLLHDEHRSAFKKYHPPPYDIEPEEQFTGVFDDFSKPKNNHESHQCQICKKVLARKYTLRVHLITHTNEYPYQCRHCGLPFQDSSNRRKHEMLKHVGEKTHTCEIKGCRQKFS